MTRKVWLGIVAAAVVFAASMIAPGTVRADPASSTTTVAPVRSAERGATTLATKAVYSTFVNAHLTGRCLAAHADGKVFLFTGNPQFNDQYWIFAS